MSSDGYAKKLGEALAAYKHTVIRDAGDGYRLGNAHNTAVSFAHEILKGQTEEQERNRFNKCMAILEQWKKDEGLKHRGEPISPRLAFLSGIIGDSEENRTLTESERLEKIANLKPWQCHRSATTPINLFETICGENYKPASDYMEAIGWQEALYVRATLIIYSDGIGGKTQTSDCIRSALNLMQIQRVVDKVYLELHQEQIKKWEPDVRDAFNRRKNQRAKTAIKKNNTAEKILKARESCIESGKDYNNITIAIEFTEMFGGKVSPSTVSRTLRERGIKKYKK